MPMKTSRSQESVTSMSRRVRVIWTTPAMFPSSWRRLQRGVVDPDRRAVDVDGVEAGVAADRLIDVLAVDRDGPVAQVLGLEDDPAVQVEHLDGHARRGERVQVREADEDADARHR